MAKAKVRALAKAEPTAIELDSAEQSAVEAALNLPKAAALADGPTALEQVAIDQKAIEAALKP